MRGQRDCAWTLSAAQMGISVLLNHILKQRHSDTKIEKSKAISAAGKATPTSQPPHSQILGDDEGEGVKNTPGFQTSLPQDTVPHIYSLSFTKALWRR